MPPLLPSKRKMSSSPDVSTIVACSEAMASRAKEGLPLDEAELDNVVKSIRNISNEGDVDLDALRKVLSEIAHLSHKDWALTQQNAERLGKVLMPDGMTASVRRMFDRIVEEGNWEGAAKHGTSIPDSEHPWAVLVTGVNGIRKTTSMYQPWFPDLLAEALVPPKGEESHHLKKSELPCGENGFFRQLDHMITTCANEEFARLYSLSSGELKGETTPSKGIVQKYSDLKAAIFSRYRTLSELLGVLLLREAQKLRSNCMMETSGRDVAMFHYVDHIFPSAYNKLALHFTINDLSFAQQSVDARMVQEIQDGVAAVEKGDTRKIIRANAGGPYGSEVLPGVQKASDQVWNDVVLKNDVVGRDWYKATIAISAHPTEAWTAQAVRPDGSLGTKYTFEKRI